MKFKFFIIFFLAINTFTFAQNLVWHTDAHKAVELSTKQKKPLLVFFTGSDWCGWCKRLQNEVFQTPEFNIWAKKNVILLELDFPRNTTQPKKIQEQNQQLQQVFGVQGYPTVWFVTAAVANGKTSFSPIGRTGYISGGVSEWLKEANSILKIK
jgi:protein disulfide-isomerase